VERVIILVEHLCGTYAFERTLHQEWASKPPL
jgi:hypothetical protein